MAVKAASKKEQNTMAYDHLTFSERRKRIGLTIRVLAELASIPTRRVYRSDVDALGAGVHISDLKKEMILSTLSECERIYDCLPVAPAFNNLEAAKAVLAQFGGKVFATVRPAVKIGEAGNFPKPSVAVLLGNDKQ